MPIAVPNEAVIPTGTVLLDKYEVVRELGRGGMAVVYEAMHRGLGQPIAVKVMAAELVKSSVVKERFIREAKAVAAIKSPHIVDVYDTGLLEDGRPYIAMELLRGESLYDRLSAKGRLDVVETAAIVRGCAAGLQKAHEAGVVHRDLKPENVFLCVSADGQQSAKLLDFGLAKVHTAMDENAGRLTRDGAVFGTPAYMSPEQLKGQASVDHRADLWALGCIAYECLTGRSVWATNQSMAMTFAAIATAPLPIPSDFRPDVPLAFNDWFARALQRDPAKRFQSARALAESLDLAFSSDLVSVDYNLPAPGHAFDVRAEPPAPSAPTPLVVSTVRRGGTAGIVVGALGLAVGVVGAGAYYKERQRNLSQPVPVAASTWSDASTAVFHSGAEPKVAAPASPPPPQPLWAQQLAEGHRRLGAGDSVGAAAIWREAANNGASATANGLIEQLKVAAKGSGPCAVVALGHPRASTQRSAGRPALVPTDAGVLVAWTDDHEHAGHEHVYATVLGGNLEASGTTLDLSPEADNAFRPFFLQEGNETALVFADRSGQKPGIYTRLLDAESRPAGELVHLGGDKAFTYYVHANRTPNGYHFVWEDDRDGVPNVFLRHTDVHLVPEGDVRRLTSFDDAGKNPRVPRYASVATARGQTLLSYALESNKKVSLELQAVPWPTEGLAPGAKAVAKKDRAGAFTTMVADRVDAPVIACEGEACYLTWQTAPGGGVNVMRFDPKTRKKAWSKVVSPKGATPSIAGNGSGGIALAYVEAGTVRVTNVMPEGVAQAGIFAKTGVTQHRPHLVPGRRVGEWYVAWLDMESMHLEPYVAKLSCPR